MTIDEAIEIIDKDLTYTYAAWYDDLQDAIRLGLEALRRIKNLRVIELDPELHHLPGETKD